MMKFRQIVALLVVSPLVVIFLFLNYFSGSVGKYECDKLLSLEKAGFHENLSIVSDPPRQIALDPKTLELSEHPNIDIRGKFQYGQMKRLCQHHFAQETSYPTGDSLTELYRHLMFDDKKKVLFCFVPKVGCTNMKRLMLYMGGHLPLNTVSWPWVDNSIYLEPALNHASFINKSLTTKDRFDRVNTYFKFMVVRDPLERLLSAYRNKLEPPLKLQSEHKFEERVKLEILKKYRHTDLTLWKQSNKEKRSMNISVSFPEFIRYFTSTEELNEHFVPSIDMCHPCVIGYNFYANFKSISQDVAQLIERFQTDPRYYQDKSLHGANEQTTLKVASYYQLLNQREKVKLLARLYDELLFYYTIYPSERNSHRAVLDIDLHIH